MTLKEQIKACEATLLDTYIAFGIAKDPRWDDYLLGRLIQNHGLEKTQTALIGARHEPATESFKPRDHFSLMRLSKLDVFEKCVNLGLQKKLVLVPAVPVPLPQEPEVTPEEVEAAKAKIRTIWGLGMFGKMPEGDDCG